jgi:tRNA G26 N,N-dimethylase Trm1
MTDRDAIIQMTKARSTWEKSKADAENDPARKAIADWRQTIRKWDRNTPLQHVVVGLAALRRHGYTANGALLATISTRTGVPFETVVDVFNGVDQ